MPKTREQAALDHEDLAIGNVLRQLEADVQDGRRLGALPEELARAMLANIGHVPEFDEEMGDDVAL